MILKDILTKLGLNFEDLSANRIDPITGLNEKDTYLQMEETLTEEMTIDKIVAFLKSELDRFQIEFAKNETSVERDFLLKAQTRNYVALLYFIESPAMAKQKLEEYLKKIGGKADNLEKEKT